MKFLVQLLVGCLSLLVAPLTASSSGLRQGTTDDPPDQQVCVTLHQYHTSTCHGGVTSTRNITAWTQPGSPCRHTAAMNDNSVKDQYCTGGGHDDRTLVFHQTVYVHNKHCHVGFAQKAFSPQKLSYKTNKCTYGYKLQACVPGPCAENDPEPDDRRP